MAAWVLAGIALWFTRGVLDMFGDASRPLRIAMLPSVPELVGLIVLALIVAAGVAALVERWPRHGAPGAPPPADHRLQIALPLFGLAITALPYTPWLADWIPAFRALAGPLTIIIWVVIIGQTVSTAIALRGRLRPARRSRFAVRMAGTVIVFTVTFAVAATAALRLRHSLTYPSSDESHAMIVMQSLWRDGDLRIANNYAREDYDEYYASPLTPEPSSVGRNGELYPSRAIGLALLGAPVFALGGYHLVTWLMVLVTSLAAVVTWRWALARTGSGEAATVGWGAIFLSAPLLFTSFAVHPDVPAAICVLLAFAPALHSISVWKYAIRGLAVGALPWLSITYTPLAAALAVLLGTRPNADRKGVVVLVSAFTASLAAWFAYHYAIWGTLSPVGQQPMNAEMGNVLTGVLGLLFDQEFGVLAYAPATALGAAGVWRMVRADDEATRRAGSEIAILFCCLLVSAGLLDEWWGGAAPPGRPLVAVLPLLGLPIAWLYRRTSAAVSRAAYQLLVFAGLAVSGSLLFAHNGELIVQDRDGSSRLLQWLTQLWPVWEVAPSLAVLGVREAAPSIALWTAAAVAASWLCARSRWRSPGMSALCATAYVGAAVLAVAVAAPIVARHPAAWMLEPESRSRVPILDDFDSVARPHAVVYDPLSFVQTERVPSLMTLTAAPGRHRDLQPVRVLLNARYGLAAGEYEVEIESNPDSLPAAGHVALQVGRVGPPMREWPAAIAPGRPWRASFALPIDAEFVGLIAAPPLDSPASIRIRPIRIVDKSRRIAVFHGGPDRRVLSAADFPAASVFFHDEEVHAEPSGIWVRGSTTAEMTVAPKTPHRSLVVRVHSGARANTMSLVTTTWGETVHLTPGAPREVRIPPPPQPGPFLLTVSTQTGFVPADVIAGSDDHRMLGGWMEFVE